MPLIDSGATQKKYDLVIGGTGFGAMFFLKGYVDRFPRAQVLMLEWGEYRDHAWQTANQKNSAIAHETTYVGQQNEKPWVYTLGFGGGTNCWWAQTPRLSPNDFKMKTVYGVGQDWPIGYDDLEPYYLKAEQIMHVAGSDDIALRHPRSGGYPQPPHALSSVDKAMKAAMPDFHFAAPTARLRVPVGARSACCDTVNCSFCPTEAKFTALNTFGDLIASPNVDVLTGARVMAVETAAGVATGVRYQKAGKEHVALADLVAIGCNAIHTPFILMRSGLKHPVLGKFLHEKIVMRFEVMLRGLKNFDGGVPTTGCNLSWIEGDHRKEAGAALVYFVNHYNRGLRTEFGRWQEVVPLEIFVEDLPQATNFVTDEGHDYPSVHHPARSAYGLKGCERAQSKLPELLAALPVESIERRADLLTAYHIQGTCRMGADPASSIVDSNLAHHQIRNLLVLGTAVWPSCGTGNPSLTAAALSLRAAHNLTRSS
jgi:choline dehydrogenase-like flavoprotein